VPRPDTLAAAGTVDTLRYVLPDNESNVSGPVQLRVLSRAGGTPTTVRGWVVRFTLEYRGSPVPADDADLFLVDEANRRSRVDTTGTDGVASRRLRVRATALADAQDSVIVYAEARAYGAPLAGTPLRLVVPILPR
jgi:hypothetical protein